MQSGRAQTPQQRRSAAPISEDCKSARSATRPYSNSPRAISNTAMSLARLARDGNGSKRAELWWPGAGGTRRRHERKVSACVLMAFDAIGRRAIRKHSPLADRLDFEISGRSGYPVRAAAQQRRQL